MNQAVQRDDIRKKYGALDGGNWTYSATDNGDETYHVEETISYTCQHWYFITIRMSIYA
jgi:hypothetical protein